jgi:hypothetical protein
MVYGVSHASAAEACPLEFGLLGGALQVIVPIGLIPARSAPKRAVIERGVRLGVAGRQAAGGASREKMIG